MWRFFVKLNCLLHLFSFLGVHCRQHGSVSAPDQHGADLPAATAGDGHAKAAGSLRTTGGAAGEM